MIRIWAVVTIALASVLAGCAHRSRDAAPPAPDLFAPSAAPQGRFEPVSPGSEHLEPTAVPAEKGSTAPATPRRKTPNAAAPESATLKPMTPPGAPAPESATLKPTLPPPAPATTTLEPTPSTAAASTSTAASARADTSSAARSAPYAEELPTVVERVSPSYPQGALRAGVEGTVVVQARVRTDGTVAETRVSQSIPELDDAAAACVKRWSFKPATSGGAPVEWWVRVPVEFEFPSEALRAGSPVRDSLGRCPCSGADAQQLPDLYPHDACEYPVSARNAGTQGTVLIMAFVLSSGRVAKTRILHSIPALDAAAEACVRSWPFLPGRCCRRPAGAWVAVPVDFKLH